MSIPPVILCPEEGKVVEAGLGENFLVSMKVAVGSGHFDLLEFLHYSCLGFRQQL